MYILFVFMFLLVDLGKVLCSTVNKCQQNSDAFSKEEYNNNYSRNIDCFVVHSSRLQPCLHLTFEAFCLLSVTRKQ